MTEQQPPQPDPNQPYGPPAGQPYPQAYPGQPYPSVGQDNRPPSKALAVTALVMAVLGFFVITAIAAVVLAIIVLVQSRGGRKNGKGMAISALVICALWVVGLIIVIVALVNSQPERDSSGQVVEGGHVLTGSIRTGDCLKKEPSTSAQLTVELVPCSEAHREEAFANFDLKGDTFPGQTEVDRQAELGCMTNFETYVGLPVEDSRLRVFYLRPSKDSWDVDKGVTCMVSDGTAGTGSLKGAKR
jgi:hypothetical protein